MDKFKLKDMLNNMVELKTLVKTGFMPLRRKYKPKIKRPWKVVNPISTKKTQYNKHYVATKHLLKHNSLINIS
jgi:hypothetical protein